MQTLWVYTDRVAGTIQELSPTPSNPTSVKVAGQTYEIETASAAYELSDLGSYQVGDTVTLLLGRNGGVAAVAAASSSPLRRCANSPAFSLWPAALRTTSA